MKWFDRGILLAVLLLAMQVAGCGQAPHVSAPKTAPSKLEKIDGTDVKRVILTAEAAKRIDLQTAPAREEQVRGSQRRVVPYAAVLYDPAGQAWVYSSPAALTFVRQPIRVDYVAGDLAVLTDGPASGTLVVTVGAAELYGVEAGVGK